MKVYVAGPITLGDQFANVHEAVKAGSRILRAGHTPFVPHLTYFWHMMFPEDYEEWMAYDDEWLQCCDVVVRIEGDSKGSDREVARAQKLGKPVFFGVETFLNVHGSK